MIDAKAVKEYLEAHPEFFDEHPHLLETLTVPHAPPGGAVSLVERQVKVLRERQAASRERLAELVREQSAAALAAFVRHDDVATWLRDAKGVVGAESAVTRYRAATLVGSWRDEVVDAAEDAVKRAEATTGHVRRKRAPRRGGRSRR